jgi:HPt (histidine-containing phosphotransfer) domain-containing protein
MNELITDQIIEIYLGRRKLDLIALKNSLEIKDLSEFRRVGHQLKGNASTFGFLELEKIGIELEVAGESQDYAEANRLLEKFEAWILAETT